MIEVSDFCKEYKSRSKQAFKVENVSFTVEKGSITALVGPNGSGKSTVIKAICGFHYPTSGHIRMWGEDEKALPVDITEQNEKAMELCGYVPEITQLPPDMKVIDFLHYTPSAIKTTDLIPRHLRAWPTHLSFHRCREHTIKTIGVFNSISPCQVAAANVNSVTDSVRLRRLWVPLPTG